VSWRFAAQLCWRLWRRWHAYRGWWLVEWRSADDAPVYRRISQEQLARLLKSIRDEFDSKEMP
jgi:hypothetical protein